MISTPMFKLPKERVSGRFYDYRLWEKEVELIIKLQNGVCEHMTKSTTRFQLSYMKMKNGSRSKRVRMCPECYQKLRDAGVAHGTGTWEDKG